MEQKPDIGKLWKKNIDICISLNKLFVRWAYFFFELANNG